MNERTMLERAARAAGIEGQFVAPKEVDTERWGILTFMGFGHVAIWNPLTDDGDALRLAVTLRITDLAIAVGGYIMSEKYREGDDIYAITRRAIVRAASSLDEGER